jgi:hypothetical protein
MAENFCFYSQIYDALPDEEMRGLAGKVGAKLAVAQQPGGGRQFVFRWRWRKLSVTCNEMPAREVPDHLQGFRGYVLGIYGGKPDERGEQILDRIGYTRLVVGVVVEPKCDTAGRAEQVLGALAYGMEALMFFGNALYDKDSRLILAPDGSFDEAADVLGPVADKIKDRVQVRLPEGEEVQPTANQAARYERVLEQLARHKVPTLDSALHIEDDDEVRLREPQEVARRALVLSAVTLLADGGDRGQAVGLIEKFGLWPAVSPREKKFLKAKRTDPDEARQLLWRLEGLWVLVWALGDLDLGWPSGMCDVPRLTEVVTGYEGRADFLTKAKLRPRAQILDAVQLTLLIHWAVRDALVHDRAVPADLDWSGKAKMTSVRECPAVGVVAERHHALNWLRCFGDADWDDVDTPT